jgi:hypothetical protein
MQGDRRRRLTLFAIGGTLVLAAGVVLVQRLVLRDSTHLVGTDRALDAYRHQSTTTASPAATSLAATSTTLPPPRLPFDGVYEYATTGWEHIDVLGGSTHKYPATTTLTVTSGGCAVVMHWVILAERVEDWELCPHHDGVLLGPNGLQTHTFFGRGEENPSVCDGPILAVPRDPTHWRTEPEPRRCTLRKSEPWDPTVQLLGSAYVRVGSSIVTTVHLRMVIEKPGHLYEHSTIDWWLDRTGLPIQMASTKESKNDSGVIGDVVYTEHFEAQLTSLTPRT